MMFTERRPPGALEGRRRTGTRAKHGCCLHARRSQPSCPSATSSS
jgi:hypothetical protein